MLRAIFSAIAFLVASASWSFIGAAPASGIVPNTDTFPTPPNIKGLQVQMVDDALALGIHHAAINLNLTALVDLKGQSENPVQTSGGKEYRFNRRYLESLDRQIKPLSDRGVVVYVILLAYPSKDAARDALAIHPGARADHRYSVGAFNPNGWLGAVTAFLAERWSGAHAAEHGRVWGWIVGNEVNSHFLWYNLGKMPMAAAVAEYEKAFRIIHGSVRGASAHARLYVPFDHHWAAGMHNVSAEEACPGRDFLDAFAKRVRDNGELDWHVAWHVGSSRVDLQACKLEYSIVSPK